MLIPLTEPRAASADSIASLTSRDVVLKEGEVEEIALSDEIGGWAQSLEIPNICITNIINDEGEEEEEKCDSSLG